MVHNFCQKSRAKTAVMSTVAVMEMVMDEVEMGARKDHADASMTNEMSATSVVSGSTADTEDGKKVATVVIEDIMDMADLHPKNSMLMVSQSRAR